MALHLTEQQIAVVNASANLVLSNTAGGTLKVMAGAGTGKTTLLIAIAKELHRVRPNVRILYLAYNREIRMEAQRKFGDLAATMTVHGLAHRTLELNKLGRRFASLYPRDVRAVLGNQISDDDAFVVQAALRKFLNSGDPWPEEHHVPRVHNDRRISPKQRAWFAELTGDLFLAVCPDQETELPLPFDLYLKYWQVIGAPGLRDYDVVLVDEAQDANPVILAALDEAGNAIYVGDSHQSIYQFRGSVNAMQQVHGRALPLSQSFRFGPVIANIANRILSFKKDPPDMRILGFDRLTTRVSRVDRMQPHARIYRTNRQLIREALVLSDRNIPFAIAGDTQDLRRLVEAVWHMREDRPERVNHPLVKSFKSWESLYRAGMNSGDARDLGQAVKVVEEFQGRIPDILDLLKAPYNEDTARVVLTTAHRSKGREWEQVVISSDFDDVLERVRAGSGNWDAEMNLLYVAVTRAMGCLESHCNWLNVNAIR